VLVDSSNPPDVAAALVRLLKDESHARRVAAGGRHFVLEQLSWDSIAAQIERFYERVLDHKRGMAA